MKTPGDKLLGLLLVFAAVLLSCPPSVHAQEMSRRILKRVKVHYPIVLKERQIGGVVRLRAIVKADGTVRETEVVGGNPILAEAAQKSVKQWVFVPGAAESIVEVSVVFDPAHDPDN